jgi:hypothetical protein
MPFPIAISISILSKPTPYREIIRHFVRHGHLSSGYKFTSIALASLRVDIISSLLCLFRISILASISLVHFSLPNNDHICIIFSKTLIPISCFLLIAFTLLLENCVLIYSHELSRSHVLTITHLFKTQL